MKNKNVRGTLKLSEMWALIENSCKKRPGVDFVSSQGEQRP